MKASHRKELLILRTLFLLGLVMVAVATCILQFGLSCSVGLLLDFVGFLLTLCTGLVAIVRADKYTTVTN